MLPRWVLPVLLLLTSAAVHHLRGSTKLHITPVSRATIQTPGDLSREATVRTEDHADAYQLFTLQPGCNARCRERVVDALTRRMGCTDVRVLARFNMAQGRCDGSRELTPHQVGERAESGVVGIRRHYDNVVVGDPSDGESVDVEGVDAVPPVATAARQARAGRGDGGLDVASRFVQKIDGLLPWGLDRT